MERTNSFIKVWFFPRNAGMPSDIGAATIDTDNWVSLLKGLSSSAVSYWHILRALPRLSSLTLTATSVPTLMPTISLST